MKHGLVSLRWSVETQSKFFLGEHSFLHQRVFYTCLDGSEMLTINCTIFKCAVDLHHTVDVNCEISRIFFIYSINQTH